MAGNKRKMPQKRTKSINSVNMKQTFGKKIGGKVRPAVTSRKARILAAAKEF